MAYISGLNDSPVASATYTVSPLPSPWTDQDIGAVGLAGSAAFDATSASFTVQGSGTEAYYAPDQFNYLSQSLSGDGAIVARVVSEQNLYQTTKAGVMIRETVDPSSAFAYVSLAPNSGGVYFSTRAAGAGPNANGAFSANVPVWVKLVRQGNTFTGYYSSDGNTWTSAGSPYTVSMAANVLIGMAVVSTNNSALTTAVFDNVSITSGIAVSVSPATASLSAAQTQQFTATVTGAGNTTVTWSINPTVGAISSGGLYTAPSSISSQQTVMVTATSVTDNTKSAAAIITLTPAPVVTPGFSPAGGVYTSAQTVSITTTTSGAAIRYTSDGSTPSNTAGTVYSGPIAISVTTTLKAIAYAVGYPNSSVATALYSIVPLNITSLTPTSGAAGVQVTISGSGFGTVQGTGTVWLGSTLSAVASWSDTQIVATVASNSTSGTARVQQSGIWSNGVPFNISTATVSSITPASGAPGTQITFTGSGFGASQGTGQVWLGTANGLVQNWSDTQVVALVAPGSASGKAQVLQNGVMSNAFPFSAGTPQITGVSPASAIPGASVTIAGAGFGSSQGSGSVQLGNTAAQVVTWSDTQVVATVASGALTGIARVQQNGVWSNARSFTVPGGSSLTLSPNLLNMVVGDTHTIQALNSAGQAVTGLTWTSSDPAAVSLSTDDPPVLTALAAGHVTITAGDASADITVFADALPLGTVVWSNPGGTSGVKSIVPAVPSPSGVADVFAFQNDGTVQAITSDGTTAWTADVSQAINNYGQALPDFQGGLVVFDWGDGNGSGSIMKLDGITGQAYPAYIPGPTLAFAQPPVVHTDGTIFTALECRTCEDPLPPTVIGIDSTSGVQKFSVQLPCQVTRSAELFHGEFIIAGDGYAYLPYACRESVPGTENSIGYSTNHLMLMRVNSSGGHDNIDVMDWNSHIDDFITLGSVYTITNADTGILVTWRNSTGDFGGPWQSHMAVTNGASVTLMDAPAVPSDYGAVQPVLQAQDGSFIGTYYDDNDIANMLAFDASGAVRWSVPNDQPQIATDDGGVIGQSGITYDQNGNATRQMALHTYSWFGNSYQLGSVEQFLTNIINLAQSFWPFRGANASGNGSANQPLTQTVRDLTAQRASYYASINSTRWPDVQGANKCNLFVKDVLDEAGAQAPIALVTRIKHYFGMVDSPIYPASAGDWAFPHNTLACWHVVPEDYDTLGLDYPSNHARPGDVIAEAINYSDASGHVGIVVGPKQTSSADSAAPCFPPYLTPQGVIDVSDFGFRPLDWIDTYLQPNGLPCRTSGLKSNAVVKRFVCQ